MAHSTRFNIHPTVQPLYMNVFFYQRRVLIRDNSKGARRQRLLGISTIVIFDIEWRQQFRSIWVFAPERRYSFSTLIGYVFHAHGRFPLLDYREGNNRLKRLRGHTTRRPANAELKGLNNKFTLLPLCCPHQGGIIKHLLVTPTGLIVVRSRDEIGED